MSRAALPAIDQLRELAPGAPPFSYLPQTWGWLVLLLAMVLIAVVWGGLRWRRWRNDRYRREALNRLDQLASAQGEQRLAALRELPELLKRVALSMPDSPPVASLGGADWQVFLDRHAPRPLPANFAAQLQMIAYAPDAQLRALEAPRVQALFSSARQWIEAHHVAV